MGKTKRQLRAEAAERLAAIDEDAPLCVYDIVDALLGTSEYTLSMALRNIIALLDSDGEPSLQEFQSLVRELADEWNLHPSWDGTEWRIGIQLVNPTYTSALGEARWENQQLLQLLRDAASDYKDLDALAAELTKQSVSDLAEREGRYMKLPLDADGAAIHVGDRLVPVHKTLNREFVVAGVGQDEAGEGTVHYWSEDKGWWCWAYAREVRHKPTLESLLRRLLSEAYRAGHDEGVIGQTGWYDVDVAVAEYAGMLQLKEGETDGE